MTAVVLPATPGPVDQQWAPVDFGGFLRPPLGGPVQRLNRLGNRWIVAVTLPSMQRAQAAAWIALLNLGLTSGVQWTIRQPGLTVGTPGAPRVSGTGHAGTLLPVSGGSANYVFRQSQWISLLSEGARFLHMIAAQTALDGSGAGTLPLIPALRAPPTNNDPITVVDPVIVGWLNSAESASWSIDRARLYGLRFTIEEGQ
jgi:hypothetical protein